MAEVEAAVEPFRYDGDRSASHGIPPHITIGGPWTLSVALPVRALEGLAAAIRGTRFVLDHVGTLGDAVCLFPEDEGELLRWRASIMGAVGTPDAVDENWRLHLTVCRGGDRGRLAEVEEAFAGAMPIACEAQGLILARMTGDAEVRLRTLS
ncbi:MAG: 2'-5' RNA ligase family protein [Actinobacteria bacterium]|nr:2'-5' RNA ligase family protein [Actinomycetota bacterium]